jgi:hypothetical protein
MTKRLFLGALAALIFAMGTCTSCAAIFKDGAANPYQGAFYDARQSFVKISTIYEISMIGTPLKTSITSSCSGTIVKVVSQGSYVLTADHCGNFHGLPPGLKIDKQTTVVKDVRFDVHDTVVKGRNEGADLMLLFVPNLIDLPAISIANDMPLIGETVLNVAQPGGVYPAKGVIVLQSGYYSGSFVSGSEPIALYSLLAFGGSSGSMILNSRGQMIGLLHSGYTAAPVASRSPTLVVLKKFLAENWNK